MKGILYSAIIGCMIGWTPHAQADIVTDIGIGYKIERTTSPVLIEDCHQVWIVETRPERPDLNYRPASCGGDNPTFLGWPIAWEREIGNGPWTVRVGWFHFSHWFDGKRSRETHMDTIAVSFKLNWSERRRNRQ